MERLLSIAVVGAVAAAVLATFLASAAPNDATAQAACDPALPQASGSTTDTLVTGGFDREYILHVPPSYDGEEALPLVVNLHGLGSDAQEQMDYSNLAEKADEEGFIVVAPQGTVTEFIPARHWNFSTLEVFDDTPDDVAFVSALLDRLERQVCIDTSRVYAAGMSNGAQMSVRLACDLSDRFAAAAAVAGVYFPPAFVQIPGEPACDSARPVPISAFHGTSDGTIEFDGGPLGIASIPLDTRPIEGAAIPEWAAHNGCGPTPSREQVTEHVRVVRYEGCAADVDLYVVEGGRHEWPGALDGPGAPEGDEISANDLMWDFFEAHVLQEQAPTTPVTPAAQSGAPAALPDTGSSNGMDWTWVIVAGALAAGIGLVAACLVLRRRGSRESRV